MYDIKIYLFIYLINIQIVPTHFHSSVRIDTVTFSPIIVKKVEPLITQNETEVINSLVLLTNIYDWHYWFLISIFFSWRHIKIQGRGPIGPLGEGGGGLGGFSIFLTATNFSIFPSLPTAKYNILVNEFSLGNWIYLLSND